MSFKIFKNSFLKLTIEPLHTTENNTVVLKTYNNTNIKQLDICTVQLRHKANIPKCRLFAVLTNGPALLGKLDMEVLGIEKISVKFLIVNKLAGSLTLRLNNQQTQ